MIPEILLRNTDITSEINRLFEIQTLTPQIKHQVGTNHKLFSPLKLMAGYNQLKHWNSDCFVHEQNLDYKRCFC